MFPCVGVTFDVKSLGDVFPSNIFVRLVSLHPWGTAPICLCCINVPFHMAHMIYTGTVLHCLNSSIIHIMFELCAWLVLVRVVTVNGELMFSGSWSDERPRRAQLNC